MSHHQAVLADIVISHQDRAVVRVGQVFIKIDVDRDRSERELVALGAVPVRKPGVLWHQPGPPWVLALRSRDHRCADGDDAGVLDWSDAGVGDVHYDLAVLTIGHDEHLDAVLDGYGHPVDGDRLMGFASWRRLGSVRWMIEHGFDARGDIASLRLGRS